MIVATQSLFLSPGSIEEMMAFPFTHYSKICLSPLCPVSLAWVTGSYCGRPAVPPSRAESSRDGDPTARGVPHKIAAEGVSEGTQLTEFLLGRLLHYF